MTTHDTHDTHDTQSEETRRFGVLHAYAPVNGGVSTMPQHCGVVDMDATAAEFDADPLTVPWAELSWIQYPDRQCLELDEHGSQFQILPLDACSVCAGEE
jgi:hypothetical protein